MAASRHLLRYLAGFGGEEMALVFKDYLYVVRGYHNLNDFFNDLTGTAYTGVNGYLTLATGVNINSINTLIDLLYTTGRVLTFDEPRVFQVIMSYGGALPIEPDIWIVTGQPPDLGGPDYFHHFGFRILNTTLYGVAGDGAGFSNVNLGALAVPTPHKLLAVFTPGSKVEYYVDGVYGGEVTANLPNGTPEELAQLTTWRIENLAARDFQLYADFFEMWQKRAATLPGC